MRFAVLGSGSSGNSTIIECGNVRLLIDIGLSAKQVELRLSELNIEASSLSGILLTHEHGDHVRGLKNFLKKFPLTVYATRDTKRVVRELGIENGNWKLFEAGRDFSIGHLKVDTFSIPHDAVDPVGFVIGNDSNRFGFISDAGFITKNMLSKLGGLSALFVEANYDVELLQQDTKRPWSIKQRISSQHGHLSNEQVRELIAEIQHEGLSQIVLGHLSSDCNCSKKLTDMLQNHLATTGAGHVSLHCATQTEVTPWFDVSEPFRLV